MSTIGVTKQFLTDYSPAITRAKLTKAQYRLVSTIVRCVSNDNLTDQHYVIDRKMLLETLNDERYMEEKQRRAESSWVTKYLKELSNLEIVNSSTFARGHGKNKKNIFYSLCNFSAIERVVRRSGVVKYNTTEPFNRSLALLDEGVKLPIVPIDISDKLTVQDDLVIGILDNVMRTHSRDSRKTITADLVFGPKGRAGVVRVTSTTSTEANINIMELADQRLSRWIMWTAREQARNTKFELDSMDDGTESNMVLPEKFPNKYVIDLKVAAKHMKVMRKTGEPNIGAANNMLRRIYHTSFNIDATASSWFQEKFSTDSSQIFDFRLIDSMDAKLDVDDLDILVPRVIQITLNQRLHESIVNHVLGISEATMFMSHPGLISERSGILQRFIGWTSPKWGRGPIRENLENMWYSIENLNAEMATSHRLDNFRKMWPRTVYKKALQQNRVELDDDGSIKPLEKCDEIIAQIYGYYVSMRRGDRGWLTNIKRDRKDKITGIQTIHNKKAAEAKARAQAAAAQDHPMMEDESDAIPFEAFS
ncbi:hypothetical protein N9L66_00810 [Porticoccaceae bacterium]|nr:hypothetical protein [Porticoccaceae bacterium]